MNTRPRYIAIEGVIGVGKTTLARFLADTLQCRLALEDVADNPFLPYFYQDPGRYAFQTQISFLVSRYQQHDKILQGDLFCRGGVVSDYLLAKDRVFAAMTLASEELALYDRLWSVLEPRAARPDLVVFLKAPLDVLLTRIAKRDRQFERGFDAAYLARVLERYNEFFASYAGSPLLIVDASEANFVSDIEARERLIAAIREHRSGRAEFNPLA